MIVPGLDPALRLTLRAALSLLLFWAGLHKLRGMAAFRAAVTGYALAPPRFVGWAARVLVAAEIGTAAALWLPGADRGAALAAAALLCLYAGAIAINLARGRRDIDCGCGGAAGRQALSPALVARNMLCAVAAAAAALPAMPRPLTWVDAVTVAGGVTLLAVLYAAADGLLAHAAVRRAHPAAQGRAAARLEAMHA